MDNSRGHSALRRFGVMALIAGLLGLVVQPRGDGEATWADLLAPYSGGAPLLNDYRVREIRRGSVRDVVLHVVDGGGGVAAEVHILPLGTWPGVRTSQSFDIAYETPRSPSPRRDEIVEVIAETVRSRDNGLPAPDLIPLGDGPDSTVLPWWLEMLRGPRGVGLGVGLLLSGIVLLVPSVATSVSAAAYGCIILAWRAVGYTDGHLDVFGAWSLPLSVVLVAAGCRRLGVLAAADRLYAAVLALVALALRIFLGPWAPLHVNGYGPRFVSAVASDAEQIEMYGSGYLELFWWAQVLAPTDPDTLIFAANALLSGLTVPLCFGIARAAGVERSVAALAALLLAIDPVTIRFAATESYFPCIIFLCAASGLTLLMTTRAVSLGQGREAALFSVGAALLLVQAARVHPSAWLPVATVPLLLLSASVGSLRVRLLAALAGSLVIGGVAVAVSGDSFLDVLGNVRAGVLMRPSMPHSPGLVLGAAALALFLAVRAPARWLGPPAVACVVAMLMTHHLYGQSWIWRQSYDRLYLLIPVVALIAATVNPSVLRGRSSVVLAVAGVILWFSLAAPIVTSRTTEQLEYRWLREQLRAVPADCRVVHLAAVGDRGVEIPTYVRPASSPAVAISRRLQRSEQEAFSPAPCIYYVHTSLCSSVEARGRCASIENRLTLEKVATKTFSARPSGIYAPYDRDPVPTWIARVRESAAMVAPPTSR